MDRVAVPTSPDKIDVYLPSTMSGASTALGSAISKWNSQVVATGVQFQQVGSSCGTGPRCITVEVASIGSCGFSAWDPPTTPGIMPGGLKLQFISTWTGFTPESLERTLLHELGHFLGLGNYKSACNVSDAVMQPSFTCGPTSTPSVTLSANDYLPAVNSVFNGKSKKSCGF